MSHNDDLLTFTKCDVFTPDQIAKQMASFLKKTGNLLEPSVGCGHLLKHVSVDEYNQVDMYELKKDYSNSITVKNNMTLYCEDFLKQQIVTTYDNIIMNPPYIRTQDLSETYRTFLKTQFDLLSGGLVDIYYAFLIKGLHLLKPDGVMVAIIPNSYLYNKSALDLRQYLFEHEYVQEIIDFEEKKVFENTSVYCCITIFTKTKKSQLLYNKRPISYEMIKTKYSLFNFHDTDKKTLKDICSIRNGIATLRDKVFIHSEKKFDEPCWKQITSGRDVMYIIYPYENGKIIDETRFQNNNPNTYLYLCSQKEELSKRDKGKKKYPAWYAYGRSQSIRYSSSNCIYIPCFIDPDDLETNIYVYKNILHKSCLCIEPKDETQIGLIKECILKHKEFITMNSSKRSAGWINLSSRILYDVPVY